MVVEIGKNQIGWPGVGESAFFRVDYLMVIPLFTNCNAEIFFICHP